MDQEAGSGAPRSTRTVPRPTHGRGGRPMRHGACGTWWRQRGNSTGHCGGCHKNFDGIRAFDYHQRMISGQCVCVDPATDPRFWMRSDDLATYWGCR